MIFLRTPLIAAASLAVLAACGGGESSAPAETENIVKKPEVTADSSSSTSTAVAPAAAPDMSAAFADLPAPYTDADYARGKRTFKLCQACHTLTEGGPNLVGPNLYGIFGRQIGSVDGFNYSSAVADADFVWTPEKLEEWLASPRDFLPGNKMAFAGVRKEPDRHAVIAYIMTETGYTQDAE